PLTCRSSTHTFLARSTPLFFFNATATTEIHTLSLHDALPISERSPYRDWLAWNVAAGSGNSNSFNVVLGSRASASRWDGSSSMRSEEHTSELQSRFDLVCRLLLEKKKKKKNETTEKKKAVRVA